MKSRIKSTLATKVSAIFGNISIKRQLALSLMVVIIPFILMGMITYRYNMDIVTRILSESKLRTLGETARNVDRLLSDVESKARQVGWETSVQYYLSKDADIRNYDDIKAIRDAQKAMTKITLAATDIRAIAVVSCIHKGFTSTLDGKGAVNFEDAMRIPWYAAMDKESDRGIWIPAGGIPEGSIYSWDAITYASPVKLLTSFKVVGHVFLAVDRSAFANVIADNNSSGSERIFLAGQNGDLIAASCDSKLNFPGVTEKSTGQSRTEGWYYLNVQNEQYLISYVTLPRFGWRLVSMVSVSSISAEMIDMSKMVYAAIAVCVLLSLALAVILYRGITKPLDAFVKRMQIIAQGDFSVGQSDEGMHNEIQKIYSKFNWMSCQLASFIEKNNEAMLQKRNAELKALQAQINPHFLYNALDTINWIAVRKRQDDISRAITDLSTFYRVILSGGREIVTIGEEIGHIKAYVELEQLRCMIRFDVEYVLDESLFGLNTIKFILQPFVENAFMHGFTESETDNRIIIRLFAKDGDVRFEITDNGKGMTDEQIEQVLSEKAKGYGISNVNERIKLKYGDRYGMSIASRINAGTTVTITIPTVKGESFI